MKAKLKEKWLKALRSGDYHQGRTRLRDIHDQFCCLGVLCDMSSKGSWRRDQHDTISYRFELKGTDNEPLTAMMGSLHQYALKEFGLSSSAEITLIRMNDHGESFEEIADWIEENISVDEEKE